MKSRTKKAIERMLAWAVPTAPELTNWYHRANEIRFSQPSNRTGMRDARRLVGEASPMLSRYQMRVWQNI